MKTILTSVKFLLIFTLLTGAAYPLLVTGIAHLAFPYQSGGSLIMKDGRHCGSLLIGQEFKGEGYFHSRPSAISYNSLPSGGSNLGPSSEALKNLVLERKTVFEKENSMDSRQSVPPEMLYASASGLDPHISPGSALLQSGRVAKARNFGPLQRQQLRELIDSLSEPPSVLCLGEPRINVLLLNLMTGKIK